MSNAISDISVAQICQQYVKPLSEAQRLKLLEMTARDLANDKSLPPVSATPLSPLLGSWQDVSISEDDIDSARVELWGTFATGDAK